MKKNISKRTVSFSRSNTPLTSKRASLILSNKSDAEKMVRAVRATRYFDNKNNSFKVSAATRTAIKEAQE
jgi:hypothetical protein